MLLLFIVTVFKGKGENLVSVVENPLYFYLLLRIIKCKILFLILYGNCWWAASEKNKAEDKSVVNEEKKIEGNQSKEQKSDDSCSKNRVLPCMDKLREELSCAVRISAIHPFFFLFLF